MIPWFEADEGQDQPQEEARAAQQPGAKQGHSPLARDDVESKSNRYLGAMLSCRLAYSLTS